MTIKIPFPIDPEIAASVRQTVEENCDSWKAEGYARAPEVPFDDPESRTLWLTELSEELQADCRKLIDSLGETGIGAGTLELDLEGAEAIIRACSAVRLSLRSTALARLTDESLERGYINPRHLEIGEHSAFLAYVFLAGLQSIVIAAIDPGSDEASEMI